MNREKLVSQLRRWRAEPIAYVREVLKAEPDAWQADLLSALPAHNRLALKACKGPGKTCAEAWIILWFMNCHPHAKVLATSITGDNLRDGLWSELALWMKRSGVLEGIFEWNVERISSKESPETWFCSARTWSRSADANQQANTLAGLHGDYTLVVVDEVGDIPAGVVAAADASLSTGKVNKLLIAGNPTRTEGPLWDACTRDREFWWVKEITGDPDAPDRAPRINVEWARGLIKTWGADNPYVLVNVFGKFPPTQSDKLLGPEDVQRSMARVVPEKAWRQEPKILTLDVARFGDDRSVIARRQGPVAFPFKVYRTQDLMTLTDQLSSEVGKWQPDAVFIDGQGVGGGVVDRARQLGLEVIEVGFGAKPRDERFANKRAEMWWALAEWVKGSGCLPTALPEIVGELTAPSFSFNKQGKLLLESKDDLRKRGVASPDLADSLAMTFSQPVHHAARRERTRVLPDYDPYSGKT